MLEFPPIRDIAPPVEPAAAAGWPWFWWVAAAVLGLFLLWGLWLWLRAAGRRLTLPGLPPRPDKAAMRELEALRRSAPGLESDAFALRLSEILRTFLHRQTGVLARYATSPEILGDRPRLDRPPPPPVVAAFREVLTASDALKYGPAPADRHVQTDTLIDAALAAIRFAAAPLPPPPLPHSAAADPLVAIPPPVPPIPPPLPPAPVFAGDPTPPMPSNPVPADRESGN